MIKYIFISCMILSFWLLTSQQLFAQQEQLKLYVMTHCPYCTKVINFITNRGISDKILICDVTKSSQHKKDLLKLNKGNTQVPFLYDETSKFGMLESDDIIQYLNERFK